MASPLPTLIGFLKEHNIDCIPTQDLQSTVDANYDALSDEVFLYDYSNISIQFVLKLLEFLGFTIVDSESYTGKRF